MELMSCLNKHKIIVVIANYRYSINNNKLVKNIILNYKKEELLKKFNLSSELLNRRFSSLSISEKFKIDLLSKLNEDVIVIGNISNSLIYRDRLIVIKLLNILSKKFNKKIIIIDDNINYLLNLCNYYIVIKNKKIIYKTDDIFDNRLYEFCDKPPIIDFIEKANKKGINLEKYIDIYELLKAIYRSK